MIPTDNNISSEPFLQSILDSSLDGIMAFNSIKNNAGEIIDLEWLFVNDVAEEIVGMHSDELIGKRLLDLMPGNKEVGLFDKYVEVIKTGKHVALEQFYPGEKINRWFKIYAVKLGDGLTVTFQDITPLKTAELEAESGEKRYQRLFEGSIDPIFTVNREGKIIDYNTTFLDLIGYSKDNLLQLHTSKLFESPTDYEMYWTQVIKENRVDEIEAKIVTNTDKILTCLIATVSIPDDEDNTVFLTVIRDITKRKQVEKELKVAEKLSMTGKIARTIAHEVRNPLTNLTLALDQLKDEVKELEEDTDLYFDIIERNAQRISKLITDLLNSSKPKELQLVDQSLEEVVKDTVNLIRDRINLKSMSLKETYEKDIPHIAIDKDQLQIAILNLLINAIEAMKPDSGELSISISQSHDNVHLSIKDNGIGIPPEKMDNLFEPFFTAKKEGTGLGLTAVQNIIHSHKAVIDVTSVLEVGTEFIISFRTSGE